MSKFESVAVPFIQDGNKKVLTDQQLAEDPYLQQFVERFRHCFERDMMRQVWIYLPTLPNDDDDDDDDKA